MNERVKTLRAMEPKQSGRASFQAILEAAAGLFRQFPPQEITLRDILSVAGVSNQTLYNYFPNGRDDIAIALYDRFQRTMIDDFNVNIKTLDSTTHVQSSIIIHDLSHCLVKSVFSFLKKSYDLQSALFEYLNIHGLLSIAAHTDELEEAMASMLSARFAHLFSQEEIPRLVRLSVRMVRGIADIAMTNKEFSIDGLESNARKVARTLLRTGLKGQEVPGSRPDFQAYTPAPIAIVGAPISPIKKQNILDRILKRKGRA